MAAPYATSMLSVWESFSFRLSAPRIRIASRYPVTHLTPLSQTFLPVLRLRTASPISLNVPEWISDIWDSVLRAVPKKKTSHMKKRSRQRAGKALKDVTALNRCSGCGHVKRWHVLCPYCVKEIQNMWKGKKMAANQPSDS